MYHSTSGKSGFEAHAQWTNYEIDQDNLRKILIREDELRSSEEYQNLYTQNDSLQWFKEVTENLQMRALKENGITDVRGMTVLHNARFKYKDDPTMNNLTVYMRQDKSRRGSLRFNDLAPDANLCSLEGNNITLFEYMESLGERKQLPLVLLIGSVS